MLLLKNENDASATNGRNSLNFEASQEYSMNNVLPSTLI